ncbi:dihydropteroate synthase [Desulfurivibrio alkaliphilus]|uniref:Methionine synthase n=1 Tax=Desulfurivibrio alkaliphilus (strain DSM 19089 / UNIQEM U267 / AHT2) TaxID=589865 RepID=D6Z0B7_DESAT|nr:dihydropteroate synthase [Desulfurivibrio alkaliphilus]ADH87150.1 Methionine synthase [Desulfurivibrio alkaliphilus AHT 2]
MITIAEKINATIPSTRKIIEARDAAALLELAEKQAAAGADYIDVNVGTGHGSGADEVEAMAWAVSTIQEKIDTPLCIDSADAAVLEAGLTARQGKPALINSTKATEENMAQVVPLAARFKLPMVGLAMDDKGIPASAEARLTACQNIAAYCAKHGVPEEDLYFDPLVVPVSTDITQGRVTLDTIAAIKKELPKAKTVMAVSNISFGLPQRKRLNSAFLQMAVAYGLDGGILNVLDQELMGAIRAAEVLVGKDKRCRKYARFFR